MTEKKGLNSYSTNEQLTEGEVEVSLIMESILFCPYWKHTASKQWRL